MRKSYYQACWTCHNHDLFIFYDENYTTNWLLFVTGELCYYELYTKRKRMYYVGFITFSLNLFSTNYQTASLQAYKLKVHVSSCIHKWKVFSSTSKKGLNALRFAEIVRSIILGDRIRTRNSIACMRNVHSSSTNNMFMSATTYTWRCLIWKEAMKHNGMRSLSAYVPEEQNWWFWKKMRLQDDICKWRG